MAISAKFGPNTAAVAAFLESVKDVPWFSQVGQPTERDGELTRVEFDFLAKHQLLTRRGALSLLGTRVA
jgi:hypothetical protein